MRNRILEDRLVQRHNEDDNSGIYRLHERFTRDDLVVQREIPRKRRATHDDRDEARLVCDR